MNARKWRELLEGFGLVEVPRELRREMCCNMCGRDWPGKLWTDRPIGLYTTMAEYQRCIDTMRGNCYCRYHAEQMFGEVPKHA